MNTEHVERVLRALSISGRRLVKTGEHWSVITGDDRRRRSRLPLEHEEVERLARDGTIVAADAETYLLGGVSVETPPLTEPWVFVAAGLRRSNQQRCFGFTSLAVQARHGDGPLSMRHVQAGIRLIADVEMQENSDRTTMDWDAVPSDRQRRAGRAGGLRGMAIDAARRLRRAKMMTDPLHWSMAWALCVEGAPLRTLRQRFRLGQKSASLAFAAAMEAVACAYER